MTDPHDILSSSREEGMNEVLTSSASRNPARHEVESSLPARVSSSASAKRLSDEIIVVGEKRRQELMASMTHITLRQYQQRSAQ